jgi:hypothetical protein
MAGFSSGKLWNVKKGDSVTINGTKFKVEKIDSFDAEDQEHEEMTKEIFLSDNHLIEISNSLRSFYKLEHPDSFSKKKTEIPIESIDPE